MAQRGALLVKPIVAQREVVQLDDRAIGFVSEAVADFVQLVDGGEQFRFRVAEPGFSGVLKPSSLSQSNMSCWRAGAAPPSIYPKCVKDDAQRPFGHEARVQLLERAGGGAAGIGKKFLARRRTFGIHFLKTGARHIDFAPHFQQARDAAMGESYWK
jgi:hypothetical protein